MLHFYFLKRKCCHKTSLIVLKIKKSVFSQFFYSHNLELTQVVICFTGGIYCNATWDGWGCWNYTKAGERAHAQCPSFIEGFDDSRR